MATTNHTLVITIDGVDKTSIVQEDSLYIRLSLKNALDVASFELRDVADDYSPSAWDEVTIAVNGTNVFGGYITKRIALGVGHGGNKRAHWRVECKDYSYLLDTVAIDGKRYTQNSDKAIVASLFSTYLSGDGFDAATNVDTVTSSMQIAFNNISLRDALNVLAVRSGADWHIDHDKDVYWYDATNPPASAFSVDVVSPNGTTTFDVVEKSIQHTIDDLNIINEVEVVYGDQRSSSAQVDEFLGDGAGTIFGPLTKRPNAPNSIVFVDAVGTQTLYNSSIGYLPSLDSINGDYAAGISLKDGFVATSTAPINASTVTIDYYYADEGTVTRTNAASQTKYGRAASIRLYRPEIGSAEEATEVADSILSAYADGRITVQFDVMEHGLSPGTEITVNAPILDLSSASLTIQEVVIRPRQVAAGVMITARVKCGSAQITLIESMGNAIRNTNTGLKIASSQSTTARVSDISGNLGEVIAGRAVFSDGGTAAFSWDNFNAHTGIVVGLEDNAAPNGALYSLDGGTVRVKVGNLAGLADIGTITPAGWGIYTTNGFFQGSVVGSYLSGGTVTGSLVSGGTVTGSLVSGGTVTGALVSGGTVSGGLLTGGTLDVTAGTIGGWTIAPGKIYTADGTIQTGVTVNSANPGVRIEPDGLFGYGTAGVTFAIYTDPAKHPLFTSGTIREAVYEVYTSGVVKTAADPSATGGVQMDSSGIFGYDPVGDLQFQLDAATGLMTANDGQFAGTISAEAGTIAGWVLSASSIAKNNVDLNSGGYLELGTGNDLATVSASDATYRLWIGHATAASAPFRVTKGGAVAATSGTIGGWTLSASELTGGKITAGTVSGGTVTGAIVTAGTVSAGTVTGSLISGGTVSGALVSGGTVTQAGGTVVIDSGGITLTETTSETVVDPAFVTWTDSGGSVNGWITSSYNAGNSTNTTHVQAQGWGTRTARLLLKAGDCEISASDSSRQIVINPDLSGTAALRDTTINGTVTIEDGVLWVKDYGGRFDGDVIPETTGDHDLGDNTRGWNYLWLYDAVGADERYLDVSNGQLRLNGTVIGP